MRSSSSSSARRMMIGLPGSCGAIVARTFSLLMNRKRHDERASLTRPAPRGDLPAVSLRYFATNRESDAGSFEFSPAVEALEHREDAIGVLFIEADSVVGDHDPGASVVRFSADLHARRGLRAIKLQRVRREVLQELAHLQRIGVDRRELADDQLATGLARA